MADSGISVILQVCKDTVGRSPLAAAVVTVILRCELCAAEF